LNSITARLASYTAHIHQHANSAKTADNTHSEVSTNANGVFEPFVGGTEDVLVDFDLAAIFEHDGEVGVVWVVI
jgi:hypothetical protein